MFSLKNCQKVLKQIVTNQNQHRKCSHFSMKSICTNLNEKNKNVIFNFKENGSLQVQLNNPSKRNAMNLAMYQSIGKALKFASDSEEVNCVIFKGNEGFYSSGNDLSYLRDIPKAELQSYILKTIDAMDEFINELIDLKKPIIAVVDGPAIGIGCSSLGLFDSIIASSRASFLVPFSKIALVPEGCSSFTFPRIIGSIRANQMLLFNHKLDAQQAYDWGFVGQLIKDPDTFNKSIDNFEHNITEIWNSESIIEGKRLIRNDELRERLKKVNRTEGELMKQFWQKPAYQNYLNKFYTNRTGQ